LHHFGQRRGVHQADIGAEPGQGMDGMRGIADQRDRLGDVGVGVMLVQRATAVV